MFPARRTPLIVLVTVLAALIGAGSLTGCATHSEPSASDAGEDDAFPVQITPPVGEPVTLDKRPERIVSLSPVSTETLYAVAAGDQVVAADDASNYPLEAPNTELSGINLDPEAIAGYNPDLVIVQADPDNKLTSALGKTGITTVVLPAVTTLDEAYQRTALIGKATGHRDEGHDLARRTREEVDKIVAETPKPDRPLTYYHELDPTYYSVTSTSFIGQVYDQFGLRNIADGDNPNAAGGYPQLSAERVLDANPDLIFLADTASAGQTAQSVAARPGWDSLDAVSEGRIVPLNEEVSSRWGPRIVEFVRTVADAVRAVST